MRERSGLYGFTLVEIIVALIIIAAFCGLALPRYYLMVEKMRAKEGENLLLSMYASQKRYELDTGNFAVNLDNLDIDLRPSEYFESFAVSADPLAQIDRIGGLYRLKIDGSATISCSNDINNWCARLGY